MLVIWKDSPKTAKYTYLLMYVALVWPELSNEDS